MKKGLLLHILLAVFISASIFSGKLFSQNKTSESKNQSEPVSEQKLSTESAGKTENKSLINKMDAKLLEKMIHQSNFTAVPPYAGAINRYNLVIATLSFKENADRLKKALNEDGNNVFLGRKPDGAYYVIIGTYDNLNDAIGKSSTFLAKYLNKYSLEHLKTKFGIPFSDIWIAETVNVKAVPANMADNPKASTMDLPKTASKTTTQTQVLTELVDKEEVNKVYHKGTFEPENYPTKLIKTYNVVVATLTDRNKTQKLFRQLQDENHNAFIGMAGIGKYYVVINSCDTKEDAFNKRKEFLTNYLNKYSREGLKEKFGTDFYDTWILVK